VSEYCPWCDERATYMVDGFPLTCTNCGANEMGRYEDRSHASYDEKMHHWWRPEPEYCPHSYVDVGLAKPSYECEWCKNKMEDFLP
jgi:hypothetical protein